MILWGTLVYCPLAHWVWGGGILSLRQRPREGPFGRRGPGLRRRHGGAHQFRRVGTGLRLVAGQAAGLRERTDAAAQPDLHRRRAPRCSGSAGSASTPAAPWGPSGLAASAFAATHFAAAAGGLTWAAMEWIFRGKPTVLGTCSGVVAGLVCITPAAGFVTPMLGAADGRGRGRGLLSWPARALKSRFRYDDSLGRLWRSRRRRHARRDTDRRFRHPRHRRPSPIGASCSGSWKAARC